MSSQKKITNHKFKIDWITRRGPHSGSGSNMNPCIPNLLVGRPTDRTHYPGDSAPLLPLLDQYIYNLSNLYINYILNLVWANLTVMTMAILWLPLIHPQTIRYTHLIPPANMWIPSYMDSCIKMNKIYQKNLTPHSGSGSKMNLCIPYLSTNGPHPGDSAPLLHSALSGGHHKLAQLVKHLYQPCCFNPPPSHFLPKPPIHLLTGLRIHPVRLHPLVRSQIPLYIL
jgi:hypothetical protein